MHCVMTVFAATEPCEALQEQVCLTCRNAVSESDCRSRGYYDRCTSARVSM